MLHRPKKPNRLAAKNQKTKIRSRRRLHGDCTLLSFSLVSTLGVIDRLRGVVVEVQFPDVRAAHLRPPVLAHVIHADGAAGEGVSERGVVDGPPPELASLFDGQVPPVSLIQHAVREQRT